MINKNQKLYSDMQTITPFATYKKTILGKVHITVLSPFSGEPEGIILVTSKRNPDDIFVDVWSEREDMFFKKRNKYHLEVGNIIKVERDTVEEEHTIEQYSDEELTKVLSKHYASLQKILRETDSEAVVYRLLVLAKELDKTAKVVASLETRLSELQLKGLTGNKE